MQDDVRGTTKTVRQLTVLDRGQGEGLLLAHHSVVGVGPATHDSVVVPARDVGYFAARAVTFAVVATGAVPLALLFHLVPEDAKVLAAVEEGIAEFLAASELTHLPWSKPLESVTALPVTAVGLAMVGWWEATRFKLGRAERGDDLYLIGHPLRAPQHRYARADTIMPSTRHILDLLPHAHDLVPVGVEGVFAAAQSLAQTAGLTFFPQEHLPPWMAHRLPCPAGAIIAALPQGQGGRAYAIPVPVMHLGRLAGGDQAGS
ncbi:MAG: hypothetical protein K6U14_09370 [Firmicutes bacterium]|nr:hypothetical protein [Alicyclobacillaceae bacterium]MCL6497821.1 hypothetical protein [Bacillota bacterium]